MSAIDQPTQNVINKLHPSIRKEVEAIVNEINTKVLTGRAKIRLSQGLRTFAEQDALYAKGRTVKNPDGVTARKPMGNTVTKAKGGQSVHNYGFAVDMVLIIDGKAASWDVKADWDGDKAADWDECVKVFARYGWNWGGNWNSFKDMPHFDKIGYANWRTLAKYKRDKDGYIILK